MPAENIFILLIMNKNPEEGEGYGAQFIHL